MISSATQPSTYVLFSRCAMDCQLEYHRGVRQPISAVVAGFATLALCMMFSLTTLAQVNGAPASVTSPGFGGRAVNGPPASVTSLGPRGFAPGNAVRFSGNRVHDRRHGDGRPHHHHFVDSVAPVIFAPVPYPIDMGATDDYDQGAADDD